MRRISRRWGTRFGCFVSDFTVGRLVRELAGRGVPVTRGAIYAWIAGRTRPRPEAAAVIVKVSAGRVRLDDIIVPRPGQCERER